MANTGDPTGYVSRKRVQLHHTVLACSISTTALQHEQLVTTSTSISLRLPMFVMLSLVGLSCNRLQRFNVIAKTQKTMCC